MIFPHEIRALCAFAGAGAAQHEEDSDVVRGECGCVFFGRGEFAAVFGAVDGGRHGI